MDKNPMNQGMNNQEMMNPYMGTYDIEEIKNMMIQQMMQNVKLNFVLKILGI